MTRETKVGLLVGLAVILLIGILVSEFLAEVKQPTQNLPQFAQASADLRHAGTAPRLVDRGGQNINRSGEDPQTARRRQPVYIPGRAPAETPAPPAEADMHQTDNRIPREAVARNRELTLDELLDRMEQRRQEWNLITREENARRHQAEQELSLLREAENRIQPEPERRVDPPREVETTRPQRRWHTVDEGETLYHIAKRFYGDGEKWREIRKANPQRVAADGGVRAGVRVLIPSLDDEEGAAEEPVVEPRELRRPRRPRHGDELIQRLSELGRVERVEEPRPRRTPGVEITVDGGQTLSELARIHLGDEGKWPMLLEANKDRISDPDEVFAGMKLRLPPSNRTIAERDEESQPRSNRATPDRTKTYTVQDGDTLSSIAKVKLGNRNLYTLIYKANRDRLEDENDITVGQKLVIPDRPSN